MNKKTLMYIAGAVAVVGAVVVYNRYQRKKASRLVAPQVAPEVKEEESSVEGGKTLECANNFLYGKCKDLCKKWKGNWEEPFCKNAPMNASFDFGKTRSERGQQM